MDAGEDTIRPPGSDGSPHGQSPRSSTRGRRNQKACDGCRSRKVKCLSSSPQQERCQGCIFLDIACTHDRPRRRRGPPNKSAQRIQPLLESPNPSHASDPGVPNVASPGPYATIAASPESPKHARLLSSFAPRHEITRILDAWFTKVHALAPVLCRRQLLRRVEAGEGDTNPVFCGMVVSVCAATVATLRRESFVPVTILGCRDYIEQHGLLAVSPVGWRYSVDWCIAMYNLGSALLALPQHVQSDMATYHVWNQAVAGVHYLTYYHIMELSMLQQEQLKRLFWLHFVASMSTDCQGKMMTNPVNSHLNTQHLRLLHVTDEQLLGDAASVVSPQSAEGPSPIPVPRPWSGDEVSYVPGLESLTQLYWVWHEAQTVPDSKFGGPMGALEHHQNRIQCVIDSLPRELRWRGGLSRPVYVTDGHEAQTVNIFISSLDLRSSLLQVYRQRTTTLHNMDTSEHQKIIDDLLEILYHLPPSVFHANGLSLMPKIRGIGAAYLEEMQGKAHQQTPDVSERMARLSQKLNDLDCWPDVPHAPTPIETQ